MTGILLVSHPGIASAILDQARVILGKNLAGMAAFEVSRERGRKELASVLGEWNDADGVLVLVDLPGATPANLVDKVARSHNGPLSVVTGLSLPMAIRAWNYRRKGLADLADIAAEGGCRGISVTHK